jgi:hypothetical protein
MTRDFAAKLMMFLGLAAVATTFWGTLNYIFPFYPHTYPFAWYGLILFLDALLWWRWNEGLILKNPQEFAVLLFWSAVFWFFFECWNLHLKNWYFVGVPPEGLWPHVEAYIDFATVLPGMFLVYRLLCHLKIPRSAKTGFVLKGWIQQVSPGIGLLMVVLPLFFPDYFFPLVWGALIFLLEPVCARFRARSLLTDGRKGEWTTFVRLLFAGILCGGYWELCNFGSLEKWIYTVPFFSQGKLFEMPYLGFLGFPPFCVQCFVMINALYLLRNGHHWDTDAPRPNRLRDLRRTRKTVYLLMMVLGVCLSEWCYAKMKVYTIDSRSESLQEILYDISPQMAKRLGENGWCYPEQVLHNWKNAERIIDPTFQETIHRRLELVSLLHMGTANARLLESVGIDSREKLRNQLPDKVFPALVRMNDTLRLHDDRSGSAKDAIPLEQIARTPPHDPGPGKRYIVVDRVMPSKVH